MPDCYNLGIARESRYIVECKRDSKENIDKTLDFFKSYYPSVQLDSSGYYENTNELFNIFPKRKLLKKVYHGN